MKRRLFNLAAGVSLLLAVAIVFLWVRSHARHEGIARHWRISTEDGSWYVQSMYGSLDFLAGRCVEKPDPFAPSYRYYDYTEDDDPWGRPTPQWFPFPPVRSLHVSSALNHVEVREFAIAYWLLLPPTLILPTIAFARRRRRRRRETGNLCPTCGYDLRAHNAGERCPECGTVSASGPGSS